MNNGTESDGNRLLVVDDQRLFGEMIARVGELAGFSVTITQQVGEFLEQLEAIQPSVITVDLIMPGVDGIELLHELANRGCRAKILLISGSDERILDTANVLGRELGLQIMGAITKPLRTADLQRRLNALKSF
jgi:DNA-binding response OmpR family regulator